MPFIFYCEPFINYIKMSDIDFLTPSIMPQCPKSMP